MKRLWKFELTLEDGQTLYVGADGNPDSESLFVAEGHEAMHEAQRRVFEFEKVTGTTPASVRYESHGRANKEMLPLGCRDDQGEATFREITKGKEGEKET